LHNHEGQAGDQLPEEDENNDRDVPFDDNKNVDDDNNVEDDNNDGDDAIPIITPQFDSKDLYKVLGVPMNATERQIKSAYFNLAKKHHPDCQPIHLSKDDAFFY
jgi:DnaJ-domain-containing protein 1